jgi:hypothetical protein
MSIVPVLLTDQARAELTGGDAGGAARQRAAAQIVSASVDRPTN